MSDVILEGITKLETMQLETEEIKDIANSNKTKLRNKVKLSLLKKINHKEGIDGTFFSHFKHKKKGFKVKNLTPRLVWLSSR